MREKLILIAGAGAAYSAALWGPFQFDDFALLSDAVVQSPDGWWRCWMPGQTRPLTWFSFWVNFQLHGAWAAGFHAVNWLLHLASVWVAHRALSRILPEAVAFAAVAVFAVHPIQTEAVSYIFDRATLLMALLCLVSLDAWLAGKPWRAAAWFVPALLAKEECVTFPLFYLLLHVSMAGRRVERGPIAVMLGCAAAAGVRVLAATSAIAGSGAGAQAGVSAGEYFLTQGVVLWRYLRLAMAPFGFSIEPPVAVTGGVLPVVGWLGVAALGVVAMRGFGQARAGFWGIAALVWIAPSSSFLPAADLAADRRMYLPLLALGVVLGYFLRERPRWVVLALMGVWISISVRQATVWTSAERLWGEALYFAPDKVRPRIQLSRVLENPEQRLALLAEAESIAPENAAVASEKGRVLLEAGRPAEALAAFGKALGLAPDDAMAMNNRGVALAQLQQNEAARADFERALEKDACLFDARYNLLKLGKRTLPPVECRYTPEQQRLLAEK
ncbi:MAG: tetratricopeptide repeat protein [Bryobacterales bacterium]|nr:tetratricopeptide repeat protein [Bryobacterales bacterium]